MAQPLVTIIIPHRNQLDWLRPCLLSCVGQSYRNIEIILVDDASNEDFQPIVDSVAGNIRLMRLDSPSGPAAARNAGFSAGRGEFVQFLDADDYIHPRKIEIQMSKILSGKADLAIACWKSVLSLNGFTLAGPVQRPPEPSKLLNGVIRGGIPLMAALISRHFLEKIGPMSTAITKEDADYLYSIFLAGPSVVTQDECLFYYRRYPGVSASSSWEFVEGEFERRMRQECCFFRRIVDDAGRGNLYMEADAVAERARRINRMFPIAHRAELDGLLEDAEKIFHDREETGKLDFRGKPGPSPSRFTAWIKSILRSCLSEPRVVRIVLIYRHCRNLLWLWYLELSRRNAPAGAR